MATHSKATPRDQAIAKLRKQGTVTVLEAAGATGYGEYTIRQGIQSGEIATIRIGRNIRVLSEPLKKQLGIED